jgi:hypothetical protein
MKTTSFYRMPRKTRMQSPDRYAFWTGHEFAMRDAWMADARRTQAHYERAYAVESARFHHKCAMRYMRLWRSQTGRAALWI